MEDGEQKGGAEVVEEREMSSHTSLLKLHD